MFRRYSSTLARPSRGGFVVVDPIVFTGIIAILIGLALPAVQKKREANSRSICLNRLKVVATAQKNYRMAHGEFATDFAALQVEDTWKGYTYSLEKTKKGYRCHALPVRAGKTGGTTAVIDETEKINESESKGAKQARKKMFDNIYDKGLESIAGLIDSNDRRQVQNEAARLVNSVLLHQASFELLDANGDQKVTIAEILNAGGPATEGCQTPEPGPLASFLQFVEDEMELGEGAEEVQNLPGVTQEEVLAGGGK